MKDDFSFISEYTVYAYMLARSKEGSLRMTPRVRGGKPVGKIRPVRVSNVQCTNTRFPDIDGLSIAGSPELRPAEIKFRTSLFDYHCKTERYGKNWTDFVKRHGIIVSVAHDYLPAKLDLVIPGIDVFEIDRGDFTAYCRANFSRLLNQQLKLHSETKVWVMYQGPNFDASSPDAPAARTSGRWCPTENLTGLELAKGDTILFVKTSGASRQKAQEAFRSNTVHPDWCIQEVVVATVTSNIKSREEYQQTGQLWKNDSCDNGLWRWARVFDFTVRQTLSPGRQFAEVFSAMDTSVPKERGRPGHYLFTAMVECFCYQKSREITQDTYQRFLEVLASG